MTDPSISTHEESPRRSRLRRRETFINGLASVLGCLALVVMIATIFRVVTAKLWESTQVNPDFVDAVYEDAKGRGWSGNAQENPALLAGASDVTPQGPAESVSDRVKSAAATPAPDETASASKPAPVHSSAPAVPSANGIASIETKRLEIEAVIRGFFDATTIDMKLAFSRDSARVRPLMESYYRSHPLERPQWKNLGWVMTVDEPGYRFGYAQAVFADAEPISLVIEETAEGKYRVDWESSVSYGELDWKEFLKVRPAEPTLLRVIASKPPVTPEGSAPKGLEVLEIKHPAQEGSVFAYFDRNDPKFQPLLQQLQSGNWKDVPLTLRLCYPGPSSAGTTMGARIANIEGKGWLILQGQGTRS
ncbi:MAG: hypothetical protein JNG86_10905 [Verrucomicrobiaceae bacterium]|nr:hypothetical protein [Verrucomicrobiaceae bacterium]